jgi:hypothetical protein
MESQLAVLGLGRNPHLAFQFPFNTIHTDVDAIAIKLPRATNHQRGGGNAKHGGHGQGYWPVGGKRDTGSPLEFSREHRPTMRRGAWLLSICGIRGLLATPELCHARLLTEKTLL